MTTPSDGISEEFSLRSLVSEFEVADDLTETCRLFIPPKCSATYDPENKNVFLEPTLLQSADFPHNEQSQQTLPTKSSPPVYLDLDAHRRLAPSMSHSLNFSHQNLLQNPLGFSFSNETAPTLTVLSPTKDIEGRFPSKRNRVARRALFKPVSERGCRKLCPSGFPTSLLSSKSHSPTSIPRVVSSSERNVESLKNSCSSAKAPLKSSENIRKRSRGQPTCMLCSAQFEDTVSLARHINEHARKLKVIAKKRQPSTVKFVCGICRPKKVLNSTAKLEDHLKTSHSNTKIGCARCRQSFESMNSLREHAIPCQGPSWGVSSGTESEELVPGPQRTEFFTQNRDGSSVVEGSKLCVPQIQRLCTCSLCDEKFLDEGKMAEHELLDHCILTPEFSHLHPDTTPSVKDSRLHADLLRVKPNFEPCMNLVVPLAKGDVKPRHFTKTLSKDRVIEVSADTPYPNALVPVPLGPALTPELKDKKELVIVNGRKTLVLPLQKIIKVRGFETRIFDCFSMDIICKDGYALFSTSAKIPRQLEEFLVLLEETSDMDGLPQVPTRYKVHSLEKSKLLNSKPDANGSRVKEVRPTKAENRATVGKFDEILTNKIPIVRSAEFGQARRIKQNNRKRQQGPLSPFPCELCWKVFWTKGSLKNHLSRKH